MTFLKDSLPKSLKTARLELELFNYSYEHYKCLLAAMNSPTAHAQMGDYGVRTPQDFDALNRATRVSPSVLTKLSKPVTVDIDLYYIMKLREVPETGTLIGGTSIAQRSARVPPDMGWCVLEDFQGRGYATEAAKALKQMAQEELGIRELISWPGATNASSISVADKVGFIFGGTSKDENGKEVYVYVLPGTKFEDGTTLSTFGQNDVQDEG
ncbi:MAG: hypothetical protein M1820_001672 [Bogoriella megaspora]|nr:MAG: hypothetical protein M1820_001672 [Bogoriella megaspora]